MILKSKILDKIFFNKIKPFINKGKKIRIKHFTVEITVVDKTINRMTIITIFVSWAMEKLKEINRDLNKGEETINRM